MDPIGHPNPNEGIPSSENDFFMSAYDKRSLRLLGLIFLTGIVLTILLCKWARELCRRKLGFGPKVYSAQRKKPQKWKKIH